MRSVFHRGLGILGTAGLCLAAQAVTPNPSPDQYRNIPERNVFGLKSGPAEPQNSAPKTPPPNLTLTGITTILGHKLALMRAALPAAPGAPAQEKPLMLGEGQRDGNVEVLAIDEKQGSVRVNDAGEILTLTFAKNGVKPSTATTAAVGTQQTNAVLPSSYIPGLRPRTRVMPTRTPRMPTESTTPESGAVGTPGVATNSALAAVPPTPPAAADTALTPTGRVPATNQNQLSPEALLLLQALQQEANNQNQNANPPAPAPTPTARAPYPVLPPGANTQRTTPPFLPQ